MSVAPSARLERLAALRAQVHALESTGAGMGCLPFGVDAIDVRLAGGGLAPAALHEAAAASPHVADDAAATLFLAALAARWAGPTGTVLWALSRRDLFAPGLAQAGLTPERLI